MAEYFAIVEGDIDWDSFGKSKEEIEKDIRQYIKNDIEAFGEDVFNYDETFIAKVEKQFKKEENDAEV